MDEVDPAGRGAAASADAADELAFVRDRFDLPEGVVYLDGNSLGALPRAVPEAVADAVARQWGRDLITSWNRNEWWALPTRLGDRIGTLVGAAPGQIVCGDSTSVQLFQALTALVRRSRRGSALVTDPGNFPTDQYIAESVARQHGRPLLRAAPDDLDALLADPGADVGVVSYSSVDYRTGELWDAPRITAAAHAAGALILWDLSHAVGAVPVELDRLDDVGADAAVGCSYKYLNGGPGAPAWIYLPHRHQDADLPLTGWHGAADPFALTQTYEAAPGIARARVGTPSILAMIALEAALSAWDGVDITAVRRKSVALSQHVIEYADRNLTAFGVEVGTPRDPARRGSQVALRIPHAYEVTQALIARGVIGDFRAPDVLRLGLAALYLRHTEVHTAMEELRDVLSTEAWRAPEFARDPGATVT